MKLSIENFGPIGKADIELKPVTVLIGPNMAGKSYAAMLFEALCRSASDRSFGGPFTLDDP